MMAELRRLWCLLDSHGIHLLRARYIRSEANVWAVRLSRHLDSDDWQLDPLLFSELESRFGPHSIDRFASALNTMLPRYNAVFLDPTCEAMDCRMRAGTKKTTRATHPGPYYATSCRSYGRVAQRRP
eukprot:jgi/Tetstr1/456929/TSEL_043599.t1